MAENIVLVTAIVMVCLTVAFFALCMVKRKAIATNSKPRKAGRIVLSLLLVVTCVANFVALRFTNVITMYFTTIDLNDSDIQKVRNESTETAKSLADEGFVLLKNENNVLPLANKQVNVFGYSSIDINFGGTGSGSGSNEYNVGFYEGLENAGISVNEDLKAFYNDAYTEKQKTNVMAMIGGDYNSYEPSIDTYTEEMIDQAKDYSDTAIVVLTRNGGEGGDLPQDTAAYQGGTAGEHYLELNKNERDMIAMVEENFENIIVVINSSNAMELGFLDDEAIDGALWIGGPGCEGCNSLAQILDGEINPSGRLADTYAYDLTSNPSYYNFGQFLYENTNNKYKLIFDNPSVFNGEHYAYVDYAEGIYVGYRFHETAAAEGFLNYEDAVSYPFGYGMSYTSFEQKMGDLNVDADGNITVEVTVTNTGSVAGKEVVELYYNPPYINGGIEKSTANLIAFDKTELLEAGASETVTLSFTAEDMASYDTYNHGCYVLEAGDYIISLQSDSHNVIDSKTYNVAADIVYDESNPRSTDETAAVNQFGFAEGDVTYLSRADGFANYTEATAAPSNRSMSEESKAQYLDNSNYNPEDYNNQNDVMPATGADNGVQLVDLRGLDYEDELWDTLLDELTVDEMSNLIAFGGYQTAAIDSIGKVATTDCDGPVDIYNNFTGVSSIGLPAVVMLAFTWNTDIAQEYGECIASMADEMNVSGWYAPSMNMHRNSFAGRNFEYYSEDGFIAGKLAASVVQGSNKYGVYAYIKHFALNDQETDRWYKNSMWCNEQTIREIYLKPFETAVKEGHATAVMSSYNYIGPVWSGACAPLQQTVLRDEWGFRGMVITDYFLSAGGAMNSDQAIRNGSDLMLTNIDAGTNNLQDTTSATGVLAMRNATHNILYTVVNSRAYDGDNLNSGMPAWEIMMIVIDLVIAALLVLLEVFVVRKGYKKRKETIIVTESEK